MSDRPRIFVVVIAMLLHLAAAKVVAQLDLDRPYVQPLPNFYVEERIEQLDQQIDQLRRAPAALPNTPAYLVNQASIQIRSIARVLLRLGDASADSSYAVLAGTTLANHVEAFDALFARYMTLEGAAGQRLGDALRRFIDEERVNLRPDSIAPEDVRVYLLRTMSGLLAALPAVDARLAGSWPPPRGVESSHPGFDSPTPTADDITALAQRINSLTSAAEARAHMARVLEMLNRAAGLDAYAPQTAESFRHMRRVADYIASLDQVTWLGESERLTIEHDLRDAMAAYLDPRQRNEAQRRFEQLFAFESLLASLAQLRVNDPVVEALRDLFAAALGQLRGQGEERLIGAAMLRWATRAGQTIARERSLTIEGLEPDLRTAFARFTEHYMQSERLVADIALQIAENPRAIALPAASVSLNYLDQRCEDLATLVRLRGFSQRLASIAAASRTDVARHVSQLAQQLQDSTFGPEASRAIGRFDRQVATFTQMPGEAQWRAALERNEPVEVPYIGTRMSDLLRQIDAQRRAWVRAWAAGEKAPAAAATLDDLTLLMTLLTRGRSLEALCAEDGTFNRWAGVELDPIAVRQLAGGLRQRMIDAIDEAVRGDWLALADTMRSVRREHLAAVVLVELHDQLHQRLATLRNDVAAALSQLLLQPWDDALLGDAITDLALFSRCINERAHRSLSVNSAAWRETDRLLHETAHLLAQKLQLAVD